MSFFIMVFHHRRQDQWGGRWRKGDCGGRSHRSGGHSHSRGSTQCSGAVTSVTGSAAAAGASKPDSPDSPCSPEAGGWGSGNTHSSSCGGRGGGGGISFCGVGSGRRLRAATADDEGHEGSHEAGGRAACATPTLLLPTSSGRPYFGGIFLRICEIIIYQ